MTTLHGRQIKVPRFILRTREKQLSLFSFLTFPVKQNFPLYFFTNKKKTSRKSIEFPQPQFSDLNNCKWRTFKFESLELPTQGLIFLNWGIFQIQKSKLNPVTIFVLPWTSWKIADCLWSCIPLQIRILNLSNFCDLQIFV